MPDVLVKISKADAALLVEAYKYSQFSDITKHGNGYHHGVPVIVRDALYRVLDAMDVQVVAHESEF